MQIARRALSASKPAIIKITDVVRGSNANWHRRLFATSAAVEVSKIRKSPKRVSKDERKAMAESFVNKYRAMNGGKFPTVSVIQNHVGGSYYTVKNIFQELMRNSASSNCENVHEKKVDTVEEASTNIQDVSEKRPVIDERIYHDDHVRLHDINTVDSGLKIVVENERTESPSYYDKLSSEVVQTKDDNSSPVAKQKDIAEREPEVASNKCPKELEHDLEMKSPSEGVLNLDRSKPPESENVVVDLPGKQSDEDRELSKQSSVWGNIKSLAGGIINLWKKF